MSRFASAVFVGGVALGMLLLLVWWLQRRLVYFPVGAVPAPVEVGLPDAEVVSFSTDDGLTLQGWFLGGRRAPALTAIVFNGNAGNRAFRAGLAAALWERDIQVLLFDYRGYGGSEGRPTEAGLRTDARAARRYALSRDDVEPKGLVYFGESLGTALAVGLAVEHPPAALVLRSPFASLVEVGRYHYALLPVGLLLQDRFLAIDEAPRLTAPTLVVAGDRDRVVPLGQTQRLYEAVRASKEILVVTGADHNDAALLDGEMMIDAVVRFLRRVT